MKILKAIVDEMPDCCADCPQLSLRSREDLWPHCCGLTDDDVMETEGDRPHFCPLQLKSRNKLQSIFNPTSEEKHDRLRNLYSIHRELAMKKGCTTCKHCIHLMNYPGFVTGEECECDAGLECDTVLYNVHHCKKWEDRWPTFEDCKKGVKP